MILRKAFCVTRRPEYSDKIQLLSVASLAFARKSIPIDCAIVCRMNCGRLLWDFRSYKRLDRCRPAGTSDFAASRQKSETFLWDPVRRTSNPSDSLYWPGEYDINFFRANHTDAAKPGDSSNVKRKVKSPLGSAAVL